MQLTAWILSLIFMSLVILGFAVVFFRSGRRIEDYPQIQKKGYRIRNYYLLVVLAILVIAGVLSFPHLPYQKPASASGDPVVIKAVGQQFSWDMSAKSVKAGQLVEFDVTSKDVNHGFGVYDANNQLLTETQAMPDYTNKLYYTFTKPGKYKIMCLEYCGVAHHYMIADFEVTE